MRGDQVPFSALHLQDVDWLERVAVLAERDRPFQRRIGRHRAQYVTDGGALGGKLARIAADFALLHGVRVEHHDVIGRRVELRAPRDIRATSM